MKVTITLIFLVLSSTASAYRGVRPDSGMPAKGCTILSSTDSSRYGHRSHCSSTRQPVCLTHRTASGQAVAEDHRDVCDFCHYPPLNCFCVQKFPYSEKEIEGKNIESGEPDCGDEKVVPSESDCDADHG